MASFTPRLKKRRLPKAPEGSSIGGASLYDAFIESLWRSSLDEYNRRELSGPYPSKEEWWDDPRSRLDLLRQSREWLERREGLIRKEGKLISRDPELEEQLRILEEEFKKLDLHTDPSKKREEKEGDYFDWYKHQSLGWLEEPQT